MRIGTRGSELALAQAREFARRLMAAHGQSFAYEIVAISTKGDRVLDRPLAEIGGKGLFTEEIERQLSSGEIDCAVHSSKDMPTRLPAGLELACFLPREAPGDAFIGRSAASLTELSAGSTVGTASLRRQALIGHLRPDLKCAALRGNVPTRLRKLDAGEVDAVILAVAGLNRLGLGNRIGEILAPDTFPPAPGQGAICIEARIGDDAVAPLLRPLNHAATATALAAERAFLAGLDGDCRTPIAGHAEILDRGKVRFSGMILSPDGKTMHRTERLGVIGDAAAIGRNAAEALRAAAGADFFARWK